MLWQGCANVRLQKSIRRLQDQAHHCHSDGSTAGACVRPRPPPQLSQTPERLTTSIAALVNAVLAARERSIWRCRSRVSWSYSIGAAIAQPRGADQSQQEAGHVIVPASSPAAALPPGRRPAPPPGIPACSPLHGRCRG